MANFGEFLISGQSHSQALSCSSTGRSLSYEALRAVVVNNARHFESPSLGGRKALVFQAIRNTLDDVTTLLGALVAGHTVSLLKPEMASEQWAQLIDAYRPEFLVGAPATFFQEGKYSLSRPETTTGPAIAMGSELATNSTPPINPDLAILLSTSGTTGSSKFVRLTHTNLWSNAQDIAKVLGISDSDVGCAHLPLHYSYGLSVLTSHLGAGAATLISSGSFIDSSFWTNLRSFGCTSLPGVPTHFELLKMLQVPRLDFGKVRYCTQAGGKIPDALLRHIVPQLHAKGISFFVMYGQTEAAPRLSTLPAKDVLTKIGSVGPALSGGRFEIIGPEGAVMPAGVTGNIVYSGPNVMLGYAESRACLARGDDLKGRLDTGDIGHLDRDGYLYIDGRVSRFAKVHSVRINLDDVEQIVSRHGNAVAIEHGGSICLVIKDGTSEQAKLMAETASRELDIHPADLKLHRVDKLPLLSSGKIDYQELNRRLAS